MKKLFLSVLALVASQFLFSAIIVHEAYPLQIIHADPNGVNDVYYHIDLDNNGSEDVLLTISDYDLTATGKNGNKIEVSIQGFQIDDAIPYQCGAVVGTHDQATSASLLLPFALQHGTYLFVYFYNGQSTYKRAWIRLDVQLSSIAIFSWAYTTTTTEVIVAGQGECTTTTDITDLAENKISVELYPNPAKDQLFIETNGTEIEQVNIYNTTGSLVMTVLPSTAICQLSTGSLPTGLYIAEIRTKESSVRKRWVKM